MRPEHLDRETVSVEPAGLYAFQPIGLNDRTRLAALWPKKRSRSPGVVADTGQMHPRGQSRGNQNIGAWHCAPPADRRRSLALLPVARVEQG
jgi:hypothetical protein